MTANPHTAMFKARVEFNEYYKAARRNKTNLDKDSVLRDLGLKHPISEASLEKYIQRFYVRAGLLVEDVVAGEYKVVQPSKAEEEADSVLRSAR